MDRIVCLVAESGAGKTTLAIELEKKGYNVIKSYTTRPPREPDEWGHIFVNESPKEVSKQNWWPCNITSLGKGIIAYTYIKGHHYWALESQYKGKGISIYVIDPRGVKELKDRLWNQNIEGEVDVIGIYLKADKETRLARVMKEYRKDIAEERLARDNGKFDVIECDYAINANRSVEEVLNDVIKIIEQ